MGLTFVPFEYSTMSGKKVTSSIKPSLIARAVSDSLMVSIVVPGY